MVKKSILSNLRSHLVSNGLSKIANIIGEPIIVSNNNVTVKNIVGSSAYITIDSTTSWRLTTPNWISATPKSGKAGSTMVTLTASSVFESWKYKRNDIITIYQQNNSKVVNIVQLKPTNSDILLTLKSKINSIYERPDIGWSALSPINQWKGVKVKNGDIVELNLSEVMLNLFLSTPKVASALAHFSKLKKIDLSNSNISGNLNDLLSSLSIYNTELEVIILDNNSFEKSTYITTDIQKLKHLKQISFNNCNVACKIPPTSNVKAADLGEDGAVYTLQKARCGRGVDVVITGDGFVEKDMVRGGLFQKTAYKTMEVFFSIEPTKSFRDYFNVYMVKAVSKDSGYGKDKSTKFSTSNKNRTVIGDNDCCMKYAEKVYGIAEHILVICIINDSNNRRGSCNYHSKGAIAYCSNFDFAGSEFKFTLWHEAIGHGLGLLEDEYIDINNPSDLNSVDKSRVGVNIDFTSDSRRIKWRRFLELNRYRDSVGIFEGGLYNVKGVWRPSKTSIMNNWDSLEFNAPSRYQIVSRIMTLAGKKYTFDEFLEYDKINL